MKHEEDKYAERRTGELLPRRARHYVPPHDIPDQPDARTMENATVRLEPGVDPRFALTQLDQRAVRGKQRVWWGLFIGSAVGTALGVLIWFGDRFWPSSGPLQFGSSPAAPQSAGEFGAGFASLSGGRSVDWASLRTADEATPDLVDAGQVSSSAIVEELDGAAAPDAAATDGPETPSAFADVPVAPQDAPGSLSRSAGAAAPRISVPGRAVRSPKRPSAGRTGGTDTPKPGPIQQPEPGGSSAAKAATQEQNQVWVKPKDRKVWLK